MSIATEILSLRHDQSSSVVTLLAALEWQHIAQSEHVAQMRRFATVQAADLVLLNVAIHALEAQNALQVPATRRSIQSTRRSRHRSKTDPLSQRQRRLFA